MIHETLVLDIGPTNGTPLGEDALRYEKQVIYAGSFVKNDPVTGELLYKFSVTEQDIDHWISEDAKLRAAGLDVPMPVGHTEDPLRTAAYAESFCKKLDHKGRVGLFCVTSFKTPEYATQLKDTNVSIYVPRQYTHNGNVFERPIKHVAFTDYPAVPDLGPAAIAASVETLLLESDDMKLKELAKAMGLTFDDAATDEQLSEAILNEHKRVSEKLKALEEKTTAELAASAETVKRLTKETRALKIDSLFAGSKPRITAAQAKALKEEWASDALSLSTEANESFNSVISTLEKNAVLQLGTESTGSQNARSQSSNAVSPLVKHAQARAARK